MFQRMIRGTFTVLQRFLPNSNLTYLLSKGSHFLVIPTVLIGSYAFIILILTQRYS